MLLHYHGIYWLELASQIFGLFTPIILLVWFCYSQYINYLKTYCKEIEGTYAGFVNSSRNLTDTKGLNAGIIMHVKDVNDKGFFKGEFEYGETLLTFKNNIPTKLPVSTGIHFFLGKLDYRFYLDKIRHPLKSKENRVYKGKLYVITRFDFPFETIEIEEYLHAVYNVIHYREMKILKFTLLDSYEETAQKLPMEFTLYKSAGFSFEPLTGVNHVVFKPMSKK